jgi:ABC-type iron transport system FetAB ATPase subunit
VRLRVAGLRSALAGPFEIGLAAGECLAVSGPSGSGKSLFLRMVADLDPNEGDAWLDGRPRSSMAAPAWRRMVPYVAAESGWWGERVSAHFAAAHHAAAKALAARLGLAAELFDGPVARLSTGEKQRLALIRALVLDAPALLLDEPTGPLDPVSVATVEELLRERLAAGAALLLVTHAAEQAVRLATRRAEMRERTLHFA